jgi:nucleoside-triphosphatase
MLNVFLTGAIRSGKSTAVDGALALLAPVRIGGFRTIKAPADIPNAIGAVYIVPACGPALTNDHLVGIRWGNGKFTAFPEAFETGGCAILQAVAHEPDIIIMDELGVMEQQARSFCAAVLAALDGSVPVLGVIKPQAAPLLDAIRNHHKSMIIEVTLDNRDSLPERIAGIMQQLNRETQ